MLNLVHGSHQVTEKSKAHAREVMYWPGMTEDIENTVIRCSKCAEWRINNQKEPLIPHEVPISPWQKLGADLFVFIEDKLTSVLWIISPSFLKSAYFKPR